MSESLQAPIAVVSGGSRGMGLAAANLFAGQGARVAVLGRSPEALEEASAQLQRAGALDVLALAADVTDDHSVATAFSTIDGAWGQANILVNAVGPAVTGRFDDLSDEVWRVAFEDGVMSAVHCIRHGLPLLRRASWARIVNVTALSTKHQSPGLIAYSAAKSALASLTKNLARTLGPEGILVNAVAPGAVLSDGVRGAVAAAGGDPNDPTEAYRVMAEAYGSSIDVQRVGLPAEVAEVVAFCGSLRNTYMTGAHINVDGGSDFC
jgi:3-oxoacyl-[acyl-carrier protein] reductase